MKLLLLFCLAGFAFALEEETAADDSEACVMELVNDGSLEKAVGECTLAGLGISILIAAESDDAENVTPVSIKCGILSAVKECLVEFITEKCGEELREEAESGIQEGFEEEDPDLSSCANAFMEKKNYYELESEDEDNEIRKKRGGILRKRRHNYPYKRSPSVPLKKRSVPLRKRRSPLPFL